MGGLKFGGNEPAVCPGGGFVTGHVGVNLYPYSFSALEYGAKPVLQGFFNTKNHSTPVGTVIPHLLPSPALRFP